PRSRRSRAAESGRSSSSRCRGGRLSFEEHADVLGLGVGVKLLGVLLAPHVSGLVVELMLSGVLLAPQPAFLEAAERRAEEVPAAVVDPHEAGLDVPCKTVRGAQVAGVSAGG